MSANVLRLRQLVQPQVLRVVSGNRARTPVTPIGTGTGLASFVDYAGAIHSHNHGISCTGELEVNVTDRVKRYNERIQISV